MRSVAVTCSGWLASLVLIALLGVLAPGCGKQPGNAASPAGAPTPAVTVPAAQPRVVVLSPALAITLKDLGLAPLVVGRHGYDMVLDKSLPVCGDQAGIDYEALLRVNPTHVILQWGARPLPPRLEELAQTHHWIVMNQEVLSLRDIRTSAVEMYDLLAGPDMQRTESSPPGKGAQKPAEGQSLAPALFVRMDRAFARRGAGFPNAGRVLLLLSTSPAAAVGPGSFHQQVLEAIGGVPALTKGGPYQELDTEDIAGLAPDAVVLLMPKAMPEAGAAPTARTAEQLTALLGPLANKPIPAIQRGRVALIDDPLCLMPGSSMAEFADRLAEILKSWEKAPASR